MSVDMVSERVDDTRARFCQEVRSATRTTGVSAGALAILLFPTWTVFDYLVEPGNADAFLDLRLLVTLPIAALWLTLVLSPIGRRHPEPLLLGIMVAISVGVSLMIARVEDNHGAYALGMSLIFYAGAFLLIWSPAWTAGQCGLSLAALTIVLLLSDPIPMDAVATVYFYLVSAAAISFLGQLHRQRVAWSEFESRAALEREQERSRELVAELDRQSHEDALTGLANRRAWDESLERECARSARDGSSLAVLLCDLDGLKEINDRLGHPVGDTVLKTVGKLLRARSRDADLVARIGGDEFGVLSAGTDLRGGTELAEQLRRLVAEEATAAAGLGGVSISIGVADWEGPDDSAETVMLRADRRLYTAKATRNVVCAGDPPRLR